MAILIPKRVTLVNHVVAALRAELESGKWPETLPSERQLADDLQVSRETLRQALQVLEKDGWLKGGSRRRRQVAKRLRQASVPAKVVGLLTPGPLEQNVSRIIVRTDWLRRHLANTGIELVVKHGARYFSTHHHRALAQLVQEVNAACWVLQGSTPSIQKWFSEHNVPALVMGPCFEGIDLPSIDMDFQAITRHAAGLLLARGHERIAFISQGVEYAGDYYSRRGIQEAIEAGGTKASALFLDYDGTLTSLCRVLDRAFRKRETAPTALIAPARTIYTAVTLLAQQRIIAGQDYAFISRDDDTGLNLILPSVARYEFDPATMGHRLYMATMRIVNQQHSTDRHLRLMPRFVKGDSLECVALAGHK